MDEATEYDDLEGAITQAVQGALVTRWVVLAEVIDSEGDTTFQSMSSDQMSAWVELGMLELRRGAIHSIAYGEAQA